MSSTLPTGLPPSNETIESGTGDETSSLPQMRGMRLRQVMDVSSAPPSGGDSLVYNAETGHWEPLDVTPGPGEVTDVMIGDRTIDDTVAPASPGLLGALLNGLANMVKSITGKPDWLTAPAITLESLSVHASRHATGGADPLTPASIGASDTAHVHANATSTAAGFMPTASVTKLAGIETGATATLHPDNTAVTTLGVGASQSPGTSSNPARRDHSHGMPGVATTTTSGFMSSADKVALNAKPNLTTATNPGNEGVGSGTLIGTSSEAAKADHRHSMPGVASTTTAGFMSSADKAKLDSLGAITVTEFRNAVAASNGAVNGCSTSLVNGGVYLITITASIENQSSTVSNYFNIWLNLTVQADPLPDGSSTFRATAGPFEHVALSNTYLVTSTADQDCALNFGGTGSGQIGANRAKMIVMRLS